jgi:hypothetical protein
MVTMSTIDAAKEAHVSVRQLNHWAATGYLHPRRDPGGGFGNWAWPVEEVDRAEMLGVLSRALHRSDLFVMLAEAIEHGTALVMRDGYYDVVVSWRRTEGGADNGTSDTTQPASA